MEKFHALRIEKVLTAFKVKSVTLCTQLNCLLSGHTILTDFENTLLDVALERYIQLGRGWNEEELKMHFISAVLTVSNTNIPGICKTFFERPLSGIVNNYELNIKTDCMVASYDEGGEPVIPYFFLQEFKQAQRFGKSDPEGQMLAAMLLAQQQNADAKYIYGCYVIERHWYFTTLLNNDYCVSPAYDSTKKSDLLQIVYILRKLKELILMRNV